MSTKKPEAIKHMIVVDAMLYDGEHRDVGYVIDCDATEKSEIEEQQRFARYMTGIGRCAAITADDAKKAKADYTKKQATQAQSASDEAVIQSAIKAAAAAAETKARADLAAAKAK